MIWSECEMGARDKTGAAPTAGGDEKQDRGTGRGGGMGEGEAGNPGGRIQRKVLESRADGGY